MTSNRIRLSESNDKYDYYPDLLATQAHSACKSSRVRPVIGENCRGNNSWADKSRDTKLGV